MTNETCPLCGAEPRQDGDTICATCDRHFKWVADLFLDEDEK